MATELDISLRDDDDIIVTISLSSVNVTLREMRKLMNRCESKISEMVRAGAGAQAMSDQLRRKEIIGSAIADLKDIEAKVRLKERSQG